MAFRLTAAQKEEIRRLTQLANRRIKAATKAYESAGKTIVPREIVGDIQRSTDWSTRATPLSRSVVFESESEYRKQLRYLKSFEHQRPGIREYTRVQRQKTAKAMETSLGDDIPANVQTRLSKMSAPQLADFWERFEEKAERMGVSYSSDATMQQTLAELYPEDIEKVLTE